MAFTYRRVSRHPFGNQWEKYQIHGAINSSTTYYETSSHACRKAKHGNGQRFDVILWYVTSYLTNIILSNQLSEWVRSSLQPLQSPRSFHELPHPIQIYARKGSRRRSIKTSTLPVTSYFLPQPIQRRRSRHLRTLQYPSLSSPRQSRSCRALQHSRRSKAGQHGRSMAIRLLSIRIGGRGSY